MAHNPVPPRPLRVYAPRLVARRDWSEIKTRIDLAKVTAALLGPPVERRGLRSGSLGWYCPFDHGPDPSFRVILGEATWSCSTCAAGGDAAALVMRMKKLIFRDAIAWLDEQEGLDLASEVVEDDRSFPGTKAIQIWREYPTAIGERRTIRNGSKPRMPAGAE